MFKGKSDQMNPLDEGIVEIRSDRAEGSVNELNGDTVEEFLAASVPFLKRESEEFGQLVESILTNVYLNHECVRLDGAIRKAPR